MTSFKRNPRLPDLEVKQGSGSYPQCLHAHREWSIGHVDSGFYDQSHFDRTFRLFAGLPLPILGADQEGLRELLEAAMEDSGLVTIPFSDVAQRSLDYGDYARELGSRTFDSLSFLGILIAGPGDRIRRLTGFLPLLRQAS